MSGSTWDDPYQRGYDDGYQDGAALAAAQIAGETMRVSDPRSLRDYCRLRARLIPEDPIWPRLANVISLYLGDDDQQPALFGEDPP